MKDKTKKPSLPEPDDFEILEIDRNLLDREWLNQPKFYFRYASMLADARQKWEEAKADLKVVAAGVDKKIRSRAANLEEKITEAMVAAAVIRDLDYRTAEQTVFTAKHDVDILDAAVTALEHRKAALENMVKLHGQNYFSTPKADSDNKGMIDDARMRRTVKNRRS